MSINGGIHFKKVSGSYFPCDIYFDVLPSILAPRPVWSPKTAEVKCQCGRKGVEKPPSLLSPVCIPPPRPSRKVIQSLGEIPLEVGRSVCLS